MDAPTRLRSATVAACAALLLATGCTGSDDPRGSDGPGSDGPSSASSSSDPSPSPSPSPASPVPAAPSVTPAVGQTFKEKSLSFVLPGDFFDAGKVGNGLLGTHQYASESLGAVISISNVTDITTTLTLDEAADLDSSERDPSLIRQPDRQVGGEEVYVYSGTRPGLDVYQIGRVAGDQSVQMDFTFGSGPLDMDLVESVLATVEWTA